MGGWCSGNNFRPAPHGERLVVVVFLTEALVRRALIVNVDGAVVVAASHAAAACTSTCAVLAGLLADAKYACLHVTAAICAVTLLLPAATGDEHGDDSTHQKESQQGANHSCRHYANIGWVHLGFCRREKRQGGRKRKKGKWLRNGKKRKKRVWNMGVGGQHKKEKIESTRARKNDKTGERNTEKR